MDLVKQEGRLLTIPDELRGRPQWVGYALAERGGKMTKIPKNPCNGRNASSTDPATWGTFAEARQAGTRFDLAGVGFVFTDDDPFTGVDLDHCRDPQTGEIEEWAQEIVKGLYSWTEASQSGTGLHVIGRGTLSVDAWHKCYPFGDERAIECYSSGRFFVMTGQHIADTPEIIEEWAPALAALQLKYAKPVPEAGTAPPSPTLADRELLGMAFHAKNGAKIKALYQGDTSGYPSQSEADAALCSLLGFWTKDAAQLDRLVRGSGLMRSKWDERHGAETYGALTIAHAIAGQTATYSRNGAHSALLDAGEPRETKYKPGEVRAGPKPAPSPTLHAVVATFRRWLHLPDPTPLLAVLGAVAANRQEGDPVWLILVGSPGSGKSEILQSTRQLVDIHPAATLTEAALLSGTPKKETATDARGGLLRTIGDYGIILCKDFGSVLSMNRDTRAQLLAALREIYDGEWTRHVGVDGGRTLFWSGKLGLIAGCTPAIDSHHSVIASMGERFLMCRLPTTDDDAQAARALDHFGQESAMRSELQATVAALFARDLAPPQKLTPGDRAFMISLAAFVVRCRSAVERDPYNREIVGIPDPEAPARLVTVLARLFGGLLAVGCDIDSARTIIRSAALDSMPALRRSVLVSLAELDKPSSTTVLAERLGYPTSTLRRTLEDLTAHGVATRQPQGQGKTDLWALSDWAGARYKATTFPEKSAGENTPLNTPLYRPQNFQDDFSGKVPLP